MHNITIMLTGVAALLTAAAAVAEPVMCAPQTAMVCGDVGGCVSQPPSALGAPAFLRVDLEENRVADWNEHEGSFDSAIENADEIDGFVIIQGIDDGIEDAPDGLGWTMHISTETGRFSAAAPLEDAALVIFGSCTLL